MISKGDSNPSQDVKKRGGGCGFACGGHAAALAGAVAARWYALKGVFDQSAQPSCAGSGAAYGAPGSDGDCFFTGRRRWQDEPSRNAGTDASSMGEKVLLTDTTSHGLLPFYFGASELRPGVVRTFSPPAGSADARSTW